MPVAAAPDYLSRHFTKHYADASPGLRFGLYLQIWTDRADQEQDVRKRAAKRSAEGREVNEILSRQGMDAAIRHLEQKGTRFDRLWSKNTTTANDAWRKITKLSPADKALNEALFLRLEAQANAVEQDHNLLRLAARAIAPFTTGLGNEHPLENGFAFLSPYGLPYLPGSGVKGVLRQAARELIEGGWGETHCWSDENIATIGKGKDQQSLTQLDLLFGKESKDHETEMFRGLLSFWDVLPQIEGTSLLLEVMTPHQNHYYQQGANPHDSGQPNPIFFLTVPPGSRFNFHVVCDTERLARLAPECVDTWKPLLQAAFEHAFDWLGFGAKTSVGYGAMGIDRKAAKERAEREEEARIAREEAAAEAERAAALAAMSPIDRLIAEAIANKPKDQKEAGAVFNAIKNAGLGGDDLREAAGKLKAMMEKSSLWRPTSNARKPEKDREHQQALQVIKWLAG